jgi:hypothetical protein
MVSNATEKPLSGKIHRDQFLFNPSFFMPYRNVDMQRDVFPNSEKIKVDTAYCGSAYCLQTFDILRVSHENRACQNL